MAEGFNYVECCPCLFATSVASFDDNADFMWIARAWAFVKVSWVRLGDKKKSCDLVFGLQPRKSDYGRAERISIA